MRNFKVFNFKTIMIVAVVLCAAAACPAKLRQVGMVDLPGQPGFNEVAMANGQVVISRPATNTIEIFSPVKRRVIARISQVDGPRGIAVDDAGFARLCRPLRQQQHRRDQQPQLDC